MVSFLQLQTSASTLYAHSKGPYIFDDYKKVRLGERYNGTPVTSVYSTQFLPLKLVIYSEQWQTEQHKHVKTET